MVRISMIVLVKKWQALLCAERLAMSLGSVKKIVYSSTFTYIFPGSASGENCLSRSWGQGRFEPYRVDELVRP